MALCFNSRLHARKRQFCYNMSFFLKHIGPTCGLCVAGNPPGSLKWIVKSYGNSADQTTGSTLTLDSVQLSDSGNYSCVASNLYGAVSSDTAQLLVNGT